MKAWAVTGVSQIRHSFFILLDGLFAQGNFTIPSRCAKINKSEFYATRHGEILLLAQHAGRAAGRPDGLYLPCPVDQDVRGEQGVLKCAERD